MKNPLSRRRPDRSQHASFEPSASPQDPAPTWYGSDPTGPQPITAPHGVRFGDQPPLETADQADPGATTPQTPRRGGPRGPHRRLLELATVGAAAALLASGCTLAATQDPASATDTLGSTTTTQQDKAESPRPVVQADAKAPDWVAVAKSVSPSVVAITINTGGRPVGQGSGVILDKDGRIITNNHVANAGGNAGAGPSLSVTLDDKRTYDAQIVGTDPATDLAVIQLKNPPGDLRPIALGNSNDLQVGEPVMAVGNPLGLAGTVTTGIVSALNRPVVTQQDQGSAGMNPSRSGEKVVTNAVQTSAAINPGNSGGALVNTSGQLIGINSAIASTEGSSGNIGIGFAIPVNEAKNVADQLIATGRASHPRLGVGTATAFVQEGEAKRAAAGVSQVVPGSVAAKAGLKVGDAVVAVDGEAVDTADALVAQIRERSVGDVVTLTIVRDGQRQDIRMTLDQPVK